MPAIHTETLLRTVYSIGAYNLVKSCIRCREFLVLAGCFILKVIGTTEIVFCTGTADGRELLVTIHEEFDFSFTPPTTVIDLPCHVSTHILALALDAINQYMVRSHIGVWTAELCMEVSGILRNFSQCIVYLIVNPHFIVRINVFHSDSTLFAERHLPVTIECAARIHAYGQWR